MSQHSPDTPQTRLLGNGTLRSLGIVPYLGRLLFLQVVPFTDSVISFAMTLPPEQPDFTALKAASDPTCRHT
jgi:hypothetical protein